MIITYEEFQRKLDAKIKLGADFNYEVLVSLIKNPFRYTGLYRVSNARTKLIQNATQSREIKFGDFMEDIVTTYIEKIGYINLPKIIGTSSDGSLLNADQVFLDNDNCMYLVEQKIRDDHDSTKKRGQYDNFKKKYDLLQHLNPDKKIIACMWFIDDGLAKNRNFYRQQIAADSGPVKKHILYGGQLFSEVLQNSHVWDEIVAHLERNKLERPSEVLTIPDPDTDEQMLDALRLLQENEPRLLAKLLSDNPIYVLLRKELFPTGSNLSKLLQ